MNEPGASPTWVQEIRFTYLPLYAANRLEMARGITNRWSMDAIWAARLGLGDEGCKLLGEHAVRYNRFRYGGWDSSNSSVFPDGLSVVPYADGAGLSAFGLNEVLLQSHNDLIRVLPAVAKDWSGKRSRGVQAVAGTRRVPSTEQVKNIGGRHTACACYFLGRERLPGRASSVFGPKAASSWRPSSLTPAHDGLKSRASSASHAGSRTHGAPRALCVMPTASWFAARIPLSNSTRGPATFISCTPAGRPSSDHAPIPLEDTPNQQPGLPGRERPK